MSFFDLVHRRKRKNKDLKVIVTARDNDLGVGKTTFAVDLCKDIDPLFTYRECSFETPQYINLYNSLEKDRCILWEEMEVDADSRNYMSKGNRRTGHLWSYMRKRNIYTIGTVPSVDDIDKRLRGLADAIMIVTEEYAEDCISETYLSEEMIDKYVNDEGIIYTCRPYKVKVHDLTRELYQKRFRTSNGRKEILLWSDHDDDEDFKKIDRLKDYYSDKWTGEYLEDMEATDYPSNDEILKNYV